MVILDRLVDSFDLVERFADVAGKTFQGSRDEAQIAGPVMKAGGQLTNSDRVFASPPGQRPSGRQEHFQYRGGPTDKEECPEWMELRRMAQPG
jgi:hypothetical protein